MDQVGECEYETSEETDMVFQIDQFKAYNHLLAHDLEKLACKGAVAVPMRINRCIKNYVSGIIDDRNGACDCSTKGGPNHAVLLVGFGTDFSITKAQQIDGQCRDYWLLRN